MDRDGALRVLDFWMCLEYLDPPKLEEPDPKGRIWAVGRDEEWPWRDQSKQCQMPGKAGYEWRTTISCGVLDLRCLVSEELHSLLTEGEEEAIPSRDGKAATIVLSVDGRGRLCGPVTFSSLLWVMGVLSDARRPAGQVCLTGFDDDNDGFEAGLSKKATDHLRLRTTLPKQRLATPDGTTPVRSAAAALRERDDLRPVTIDDLRSLEHFVLKECRWQPTHPDTRLKDILAKSYSCRIGGSGGDDNDILNSFIAADLRVVRDALAHNDVGPGLDRYLTLEPPAGRTDLRTPEGQDLIQRTTMPDRMPLACWPSKHPLVLAQQFAVNTVAGRSGDGASAASVDQVLSATEGLFSVNGPPGTGKTTLLRDVVAAIVLERANRLVDFDRPDAFGGMEVLHPRKTEYKVYQLDRRLSGFGVVVASSNNGAVENVSRELPAAGAVDAPSLEGLRLDPFAAVADGLLVGDATATSRVPGAAWGLIAAVLGNSENKGLFARRFWEGVEVGRDGPPPEHPFVTFPDALATSMADGSIAPWAVARQAYLDRRHACEARLSLLHEHAVLASTAARLRASLTWLEMSLDRCEVERRDAQTFLSEARAADLEARSLFGRLDREVALIDELERKRTGYDQIQKAKPEIGESACADQLAQAEAARHVGEQKVAEAAEEISHSLLLRPGWLQRLFAPWQHARWQARFGDSRATLSAHQAEEVRLREAVEAARRRLASTRDWSVRLKASALALQEATARVDDSLGGSWSAGTLRETRLRAEANMRRREASLKKAGVEAQQAAESFARVAEQVASLRRKEAALKRLVQQAGLTEARLASLASLGGDEEERQRAAPFHDDEIWQLRHELFLAALALHRSFVAANQDAVLENLRCLMDVLSGRLFRGFVGRARLPMLWDTFFLVVPVVSTTFASMGRQFRDMGRGSLGWLIIDEAGQAPPQAAVGGIWRARRTVVVGDPIQLEPICALPERAIERLEACFAIGPLWHPVKCSAQILADRGNRLGTSIDGRWVGAPLRVHRRCLEPMFGVANRIAYGGMMVHATALNDSRRWLGESCWIDAPSSESGSHDMPSQRRIAADIVCRVAATDGLLDDKGRPRIYVITPFRTANTAMIEDLLAMPALAASARARKLSTRKLVRSLAGTIHTFQGKEADLVVLLLSCNPRRRGAISGFAARSPNLLNVALTRARLRLYVIGDLSLWRHAPYYRDLVRALTDRDAIIADEDFRRREDLLAAQPGLMSTGLASAIGGPIPTGESGKSTRDHLGDVVFRSY